MSTHRTSFQFFLAVQLDFNLKGLILVCSSIMLGHIEPREKHGKFNVVFFVFAFLNKCTEQRCWSCYEFSSLISFSWSNNVSLTTISLSAPMTNPYITGKRKNTDTTRICFTNKNLNKYPKTCASWTTLATNTATASYSGQNYSNN